MGRTSVGSGAVGGAAPATTTPKGRGQEPFRTIVPALDLEGRYRVRGQWSIGVLVAYALLLVLVGVLFVPTSMGPPGWGAWVLIGLVGFFLARYLSTTYTLDDVHLRAWRILGGRRVPLEEVRRIEYARLRDLAPTTGAFSLGSFGWRGRMYSVTIGEFDAVYTDAGSGLLVSAGTVPLFLSPHRREEFARELSRRVRSYTGPLVKDVGAPGPGQ